MFEDDSSSRSSGDSSGVLGMSSAVFYSVLFCLIGLIILALVAIRRRVTVVEEIREEDSEFTYDDALNNPKSSLDMKSPYLADKTAETLDKVGLHRASSFVRASSFGYSEVGGGGKSMFGMESPMTSAPPKQEGGGQELSLEMVATDDSDFGLRNNEVSF
jgi:hypothetical protein